MTDYQLVYIEWEDAEHDGSWSDPRDEINHESILCQSVGWVVHANKDRIILSATLCKSNEQVANKQYIPLKMIKTIRRAGLGKTMGKCREPRAS